MDENVYEPPSSELGKDVSYSDKPIATTGQRFLNMVIDTCGYLLLSVVVGVVLALLGFEQLIEESNDYVLGFVITSLYFIPQEAIWGRSLGKLITGTRVVNSVGERPSLGQVIGRTLIRIVPFEAFSFLGGGGHPRGWHDKWSDTKVISLRK